MQLTFENVRTCWEGHNFGKIILLYIFLDENRLVVGCIGNTFSEQNVSVFADLLFATKNGRITPSEIKFLLEGGKSGD